MGLLSVGGGTKELLVRSVAKCADQSKMSLLPAVKKAWKMIAVAQTSISGFDAVSKGFLSADTHVVMQKERLLELEREGFLSLCGEEKTRQRIEYMLTKGKPLRN